MTPMHNGSIGPYCEMEVFISTGDLNSSTKIGVGSNRMTID